MKKSLIGILMTTVMILSIAAPLIAIPSVSAADESEWYMTVNGVLDSDAYSLYPFSTYNSLKIGFSKFGEMINTNENVGLEYGAVDPFAPAAGADIGRIVKSAWLNGWLCNITYFHTIRNQMRTVWASAQHGDPNGNTYGGDWIRVDFPNDRIVADIEDPTDPGYIIGNYAAGSGNYGGRKTNGTAVTEPIQVFYNGPRSFVALLKTTIYDHFQFGSDSTTEDIPLLEVRFMINFNKVKKEVVVFKELKTLVADKYTDLLKVQFSNRGEVDLGTEDTTYSSYFHFYTEGTWTAPEESGMVSDADADGLSTVYDRNWVLNVTEDPDDIRWPGYSAAGLFPQTSDATYDLAVAINPDAGMFGYTWWAAFWPSLSDWSIDGWPMWARSMSAWDPHDIDSRTWASSPRTEPLIPFYIGEWDVELKSQGKVTPAGGYDQQMYRFVTVYGVSDLQSGQDADQGTRYANIVDSETKYQLDEVFNPYDLVQAVHQTTRSWVEWTTAGSAGTYTTLRKPVLVVDRSLWNQYNTGAERIIDYNGTFGARLLSGYGVFGGAYDIVKNADGTATISRLTAGHTYKILYNTLPDVEAERSGETTVASVSTNNTAAAPDIEATLGNIVVNTSWKDQIDAGHSFSMTVPSITVDVLDASVKTSNWTESWSVVKNYNEDNFKVFLGETYTATVDLYDLVTVLMGNYSFNFDMNTFTKTVTAPTNTTVIWPNDKSETVHVDYLNHEITFEITVTNLYNDAEMIGESRGNQTLTASATLTIDAEYRNYLMGRYDWAVVGRDAESVDSAGAALVTAAFKNKQVEIGMAGADMFDPEVPNQMPWVMAKMTTGDEWVNYLKTGAGTDPANYRAYLRDDWCKQGTTQNDEWPVATANMIGVGGPLANLLSYYGNDFTQAIFGLSDFTDYTAWENKLVPKTCWDHAKGYTNTNTEGYATVSTYRDINETVLFLIWGNWGRDTFYVSRWFHEHLVYQLQAAPAGITSVVVKITYQSTSEGYKPTGFSIVECLGTISERTWKHGSMTKGGIHDP